MKFITFLIVISFFVISCGKGDSNSNCDNLKKILDIQRVQLDLALEENERLKNERTRIEEQRLKTKEDIKKLKSNMTPKNSGF